MAFDKETLKTFTPFDGLSDEYLAKVLEKVESVEMARGTLIFKRGRQLQTQYYLVSGEVDLIDAQFHKQRLKANDERARSPLAERLPTEVSAVTKSGVQLLAIERDFLDLVMAWSQSGDHPEGAADDHDWMSYLLESPLFTRIPPSHIQQLFTRFEEQPVNGGTDVIVEGQPGDYFYVLESGRAEVTDKRGQKLAELGPGAYFGEEALVGETTRNANVTMLTPGRLMRLEKADFKRLLEEPVIRTLTPDTLAQKRDQWKQYQLLDVRLGVERRFARVPDSRGLPLGQLRSVIDSLDSDTTYVVTDDAGRRSYVAVQLLAQAGLDVYLLEEADRLYQADAS